MFQISFIGVARCAGTFIRMDGNSLSNNQNTFRRMADEEKLEGEYKPILKEHVRMLIIHF